MFYRSKCMFNGFDMRNPVEPKKKAMDRVTRESLRRKICQKFFYGKEFYHTLTQLRQTIGGQIAETQEKLGGSSDRNT